jgi:hypothetical protein
MWGSLRLYFRGHERGVFVDDRLDQYRSCRRQSRVENGAALRWIADGEAGKSERPPDGGEIDRLQIADGDLLNDSGKANGNGVQESRRGAETF